MKSCDRSTDFICDYVGTSDCIRNCGKCPHFLRCDSCCLSRYHSCHDRANGIRMRVNADILFELLSGESTTYDKFGGFVGSFTFGLGGDDDA